MRSSFWFRLPCRALSLSLFAAVLPWSAVACVNAVLTWNASPNPNVTGYDIYYGGASHQYTNAISVGLVTNMIIPDLPESTTLFFAARAHDDTGNESDFSNEAAFAGYHSRPDVGLRLKGTATNLSNDALAFSLGADAPAGAYINPTNGAFSWLPGRAYASTTNYINIFVTDTVDPALSFSETLVVIISDYLELRVGATAVAAGGVNALSLSVAASSGITNVDVTLDWPQNNLLNPTLTILPPAVAGSLLNFGNQLVIQLQSDPNQPLTGTNLVAQVNFQAAPGQATTVFNIPASVTDGSAGNGSAYVNLIAQNGEVAVVGNDPVLRPQADASGARTLSLFAQPGNYNLLYTTSLVPPVNWAPLMTYQQTNVAQTVSLDASEPVIFYRLQQL